MVIIACCCDLVDVNSGSSITVRVRALALRRMSPLPSWRPSPWPTMTSRTGSTRSTRAGRITSSSTGFPLTPIRRMRIHMPQRTRSVLVITDQSWNHRKLILKGEGTHQEEAEDHQGHSLQQGLQGLPRPGVQRAETCSSRS